MRFWALMHLAFGVLLRLRLEEPRHAGQALHACAAGTDPIHGPHSEAEVPTPDKYTSDGISLKLKGNRNRNYISVTLALSER